MLLHKPVSLSQTTTPVWLAADGFFENVTQPVPNLARKHLILSSCISVNDFLICSHSYEVCFNSKRDVVDIVFSSNGYSRS